MPRELFSDIRLESIYEDDCHALMARAGGSIQYHHLRIEREGALANAWSRFGTIMEDGIRRYADKRLVTTDDKRILTAKKNDGRIHKEVDLVIGTAENPIHFVEIKTCKGFQPRHVIALRNQLAAQWKITHIRWPYATFIAVVAALKEGPKKLEVVEKHGIIFVILPPETIKDIAYEGGFDATLDNLLVQGILTTGREVYDLT